MNTAFVPDVSKIQPLVGEPEFQLTVPHGASGLIVSPFHVTTSDGRVLLTRDDYTSPVDCVPLAELVIKGFVTTASKGVARFPNSSRAHTTLAVALLRSGDVILAVEELRKAVAINPGDDLAAMTLADTFVHEGDLAGAEDIYSRLFDAGRSQQRVLLGLAAVAARRREYTQAKQYLTSALAKARDSAQVHFMLGMVELHQGNIHGAIGALRTASRLEVRTPAHHHSLGVAYAVAKQYERAERAFRSALSLSPRSIDTIHALGRVLIERNAPGEAVILLSSHVDANPDDSEARQLLARAYASTGRHSSARAHLKHILQNSDGEALSPERRVQLLNGMAVSFMADRMPHEAAIALQRAITVGPNVSTVPYENLGRLYLYYLDRPDAALDILRSGRQLFHESQNIRVLLAIALAASDQYNIAVRELMPFWKTGVAEESTFVCLGWLCEHIGDASVAVTLLSDGLARFPHSLGIINNLAYTYLMRGDVTAAQHTLAAVPHNAQLHIELVATFGLLRLYEGQEKQGRELYERAEAMASDQGRKDIAKKAKQKKYLELARHFVRCGNPTQAVVEIRQGLAMRDFHLSYTRELKQLQDTLGGTA